MGNRYRFKGLQRYLMPTRVLQLNELPALSLDFSAQSYAIGGRPIEDVHQVLTVERATPKWVYNSSGQLVEVPANQPAYQHDPVTGEPQGLLIEKSRTNLLKWSEDLTKSAWEAGNATVIYSSDTSPIDGVNWSILREDATRTVHYVRQYPDAANCFSFLAKSKERSVIRAGFGSSSSELAYIDLDTGSAFSVGSNVEASVEPSSGGAWRISIRLLDPADFMYAIVYTANDSLTYLYEGDGASGVYITGFQIEEGPTASSYIPTTDSPMPRAEDKVSRELGDEFNPQEGTIFVELDMARAKQENGEFATSILSFGEPSRNCTFALYTVYSNRRLLQLRIYGPDDTETFTGHMLTDVTEGVVKIAASYNVTTGDVFISALGQSVSEQFLFNSYYSNAPELLLNKLGKKGETRFSSPSQEFLDLRYYPRALTEQELIDLTS